MFAQGYLTAFMLGTLNLIELTYTFGFDEGHTLHPIRLPLSEGKYVWSYGDLDDLLQYTFDYAQKGKEDGISANQVLCMTNTGIVMRYVDVPHMPNKVFVPFDGVPTSEEEIKAIKLMANAAITSAREAFDDADRQSVLDQISVLENKIEELKFKL